MVFLPLVDVKFNFAVAVDTMGLFESEYFLGELGAIVSGAQSPSCLGASLLSQPPPVRTDYFCTTKPGTRQRKRI